MQASKRSLKLFVLPLKSSTINFMFPSVACSSYFGYFVQFSRCVLVSKTRSKHSLSQQMLESIFRKNGGPKWTRTTDLTIISRAL